MGTIYACLGLSNMENLDVKDRQIVILADWDGSPYHTWKNTFDAQKVLQERGNEVSLALPVHDPLETLQKVDFNDVLLKHGPDEVRLLVNQAAQTVILEKQKPVDEDLVQGKLSHEERSLKYIQIQLNALKITYDDDKREKLMQELDRDIDRMEKMGHLDKASYLDSSVRKSIEAYRETREKEQSRGYSI